MNRIWQVSFHVTSTLTADLDIKWIMPVDCQLIHVSADNSTAYAAGLSLGTSTDATAYLTKCNIGVSGAPVEKTRTNFVGTQYPHITHDTIIAIALDFNYNGGGAANASADVTLVLTFAEG